MKKTIAQKHKENRSKKDPRHRTNLDIANCLQDVTIDLLHLGTEINTDSGYALIGSRLDTIIDLIQITKFHLNRQALCATENAEDSAKEATAAEETTHI